MLNPNGGRARATARVYLLVIGLFGAGILFSVYGGSRLVSAPRENGHLVTSAVSDRPAVNAASPFSLVAANAADPLSRLLLQIAVILGASWALGFGFRALGQPDVLGEMTAGILLGPSLFGLIAPKAFAFIFAPESLGTLGLFSQIGVCFFMFAVGMELDLSKLRHGAERALVIGHASILIPYFLGVLLALPLYGLYAQPGVSFAAFALLLGIALSITAFPVLVRILQDRGLFQTELGSFATLCAAVGDGTAWCILAFVVAVAGASNFPTACLTLALVAAYAGVMLLLVRPILGRALRSSLAQEVEPGKGVLAIALGVVLISALCTEVIGIHALFGAFVAGIAMPAGGRFRKKLIVRIEHFSSVLLLPLFFAFIGLRTQIGLLSGARDWAICFALIAVATIGKAGGTAIVSRLLKMSWRDSWQLGALMNTRGLMELIVLNIGYDMGIFSLRLFTMLVLTALITTCMTGPLVSLFRRDLTTAR